MEWLIVLGLLGVVTMVAAKSRGHSAMWFWAGVLLGPIGLIWVLVIPSNEKEIAATKFASGELKKCPHCAEAIQPEAKICKHCGRDQPQVAEKIEKPLERAFWTCAKCTAISKVSSAACWKCEAPKPAALDQA